MSDFNPNKRKESGGNESPADSQLNRQKKSATERLLMLHQQLAQAAAEKEELLEIREANDLIEKDNRVLMQQIIEKQEEECERVAAQIRQEHLEIEQLMEDGERLAPHPPSILVEEVEDENREEPNAWIAPPPPPPLVEVENRDEDLNPQGTRYDAISAPDHLMKLADNLQLWNKTHEARIHITENMYWCTSEDQLRSALNAPYVDSAAFLLPAGVVTTAGETTTFGLKKCGVNTSETAVRWQFRGYKHKGAVVVSGVFAKLRFVRMEAFASLNISPSWHQYGDLSTIQPLPADGRMTPAWVKENCTTDVGPHGDRRYVVSARFKYPSSVRFCLSQPLTLKNDIVYAWPAGDFDLAILVGEYVDMTRPKSSHGTFDHYERNVSCTCNCGSVFSYLITPFVVLVMRTGGSKNGCQASSEAVSGSRGRAFRIANSFD